MIRSDHNLHSSSQVITTMMVLHQVTMTRRAPLFDTVSSSWQEKVRIMRGVFLFLQFPCLFVAQLGGLARFKIQGMPRVLDQGIETGS